MPPDDRAHSRAIDDDYSVEPTVLFEDRQAATATDAAAFALPERIGR